jgi:hypothetical protein
VKRFSTARAGVCVVGVALFGCWVQSAIALTPSSRVVGLGSIGGLVLSAPYPDAVSHFGPVGVASAHAHFDGSGCTVQYPKLGVSLWYLQDDVLENGTPQSCAHFKEGLVTGAGWHTENGLTIGDSTRKLRQLFPHVYDTGYPGPKWSTPSGSIEWDITITSGGGGERPALSVMVEHNRVVALLVEMVGH